MFALDQIHAASGKVKSGADFPQFVRDLQAIGVTHYDNLVVDGRTTYFGADGYVVHDGAKYPDLQIADTGSTALLRHAISIHQQGQTDYPTFCRDAAQAGATKWTVLFDTKTVSYFDAQGATLVVEPF